MLVRPGRLIGPGSPRSSGVQLLLDAYPGAVTAYALTKLRAAYSGSAIRVRRSSDNAEQDIGFVGNALDTASLLSFCGAGDGFVVTYYDHTGRDNHVSESTTTNQHQIVASGVLVGTIGGIAVSRGRTTDTTGYAVGGEPWATRPTDGHFSAVFSSSQAESMVLFGGSANDRYAGVMINGATSTQLDSALGASVSYYKNGVLSESTTRDQLYDEFIVSSSLVMSADTLDFTIAVNGFWTDLRPFSYSISGSSPTSGTLLGARVLWPDSTDRAARDAALMTLYGIS